MGKRGHSFHLRRAPACGCKIITVPPFAPYFSFQIAWPTSCSGSGFLDGTPGCGVLGRGLPLLRTVGILCGGRSAFDAPLGFKLLGPDPVVNPLGGLT
jgi:hypothetical protein